MRRDLHLATLLFEIIICRVPSYLAEKLVVARDVKTAFTKASSWSLVLSRHRITKFRGSFKLVAAKI